MDLAESHEARLAELERERGVIANELGGIRSTLLSISEHISVIESRVGGRRWQDSLVLLTGPGGFSGKFQGFSGTTIVIIIVVIAALVARHFRL